MIIPTLQKRRASGVAGPAHRPVGPTGRLAPGSSALSSPRHFPSDPANGHQSVTTDLISIFPQHLPTSNRILPFSPGELTAIIHRDPMLNPL